MPLFDGLGKASTMCTNKDKEVITDKEIRKEIDSILDILKKYGIIDLFINNKVVLAGGAITRLCRRESIKSSHSDLDFYFKDKIYISKLLMNIEEYNESKNVFDKFNLVYESNNAYSYTYKNYKFQFIILPFMIYDDPRNLISQFDFSICQAAYDFEFDDVVYSPEFPKDISHEEIHFNINSKHPMSSLLRLEKYRLRGFFMNNMELLKIMFSIQNLKFNTYKDAANSICGISTTYYEEFVKFLKSDEYKDKKYDMMEFFQLYDEFVDAQDVLEKLTGSAAEFRDV
jgi:hypothetical protein